MSPVDAALSAALADPAYRLAPPPDPMVGIRGRVRAQRRAVLRSTLAGLLVAGAALAVPATVDRLTRTTPSTSVRVAAGLLDWPARGSLIRSGRFLRDAGAVWRTNANLFRNPPPVRDVRALYAGVIGAGRVAVLEGIDAAGHGTVGVVAEHGSGSGRQLMLDAAGRLPQELPPLLVFPYNGNLNIPGIGDPAPPGAYLQALVAPAITAVRYRGLGAEALREIFSAPKPAGFRPAELTAGLSAAWFSLPLGQTRGSVRAYAANRLRFEGDLPLDNPVPYPVSVGVGPWTWPLVGPPTSTGQRHDDGLLFAARYGFSSVFTAPLWSGRLPDGTPARISAMIGGGPRAAFLTGAGAASSLGAAPALGAAGKEIVAAVVYGRSGRFLMIYASPDIASLTVRNVEGRRLASAAGHVLVVPLGGLPTDRLHLTATDRTGRVVVDLTGHDERSGGFLDE